MGNKSSVNEREDAMSAPSKLGHRGERNRGKFKAVDVGNAVKGNNSTLQKILGSFYYSVTVSAFVSLWSFLFCILFCTRM